MWQTECHTSDNLGLLTLGFKTGSFCFLPLGILALGKPSHYHHGPNGLAMRRQRQKEKPYRREWSHSSWRSPLSFQPASITSHVSERLVCSSSVELQDNCSTRRHHVEQKNNPTKPSQSTEWLKIITWLLFQETKFGYHWFHSSR